MIHETLKNRLRADREMVPVTLRMPKDVVESMKAIAPMRGLTGYQSLVKVYVSDGLRMDEAKYIFTVKERVARALAHRGMDENTIAEVVREAALDPV